MATYIGLVTVAAALMFAATLHTFPPGHWTDLAVFVFAAIASERWAVASSFEGSMSLSLTVAFAATLLYGPAFASTVAVCGVVGSDLIISRRHWSRVLFNSSQVCLPPGSPRSSTGSSGSRDRST